MPEDQVDKKQQLLTFLDRGLIMLHINTAHPELKVPEYLKEDSQLQLNLSYKYRVPDLQITDKEIVVTLSFRQTPFFCQIPLDSLWGISQPPNENLMVFPDALPLEVLLKFATAIQQAELDPEDNLEEEEEHFSIREIQEKPKKTSHLRLVSTQKEDPQPNSEASPKQKPKKKKSFLRLVPDLDQQEE